MRILGQSLLVGAAITLAFAVTPACADNDESIFIRGALAPSATRENNACVYTDDPAQPLLFVGQVDVSVRDDYEAVLLVGNQMIQRADNTNAIAETNKVHINGAVVRVTDANGGAIASFTSPSQGFVDEAEGTNATYGTVSVVTIDAPTLAKISAGMKVGDVKLVIANIKAFGETLGRVNVESAEYQLPIRVCNGCLLSFTGLDDPLVQGTNCNLANSATTTTSTTTAGPCVPGQDEQTACSYCYNRVILGNVKPCQTGPVDIP